MKTVGEILAKARKSKEISIDKLSSITKIDPEHIKSLEKDQYHKLPPPTFIKGFIRNIAQVLNQNPDELVAIFRRDYLSPKTIQSSMPIKRSVKKKLLNNPQLILAAASLAIFTLYLGFQLRVYLVPPKLNITQPQPKAVVSSPLVVEGTTNPAAVIQINQDTSVKPDSSGYFIANIVLPPTETVLEITSTNRFGRTRKKTIPITVIPQ